MIGQRILQAAASTFAARAQEHQRCCTTPAVPARRELGQLHAQPSAFHGRRKVVPCGCTIIQCPKCVCNSVEPRPSLPLDGRCQVNRAFFPCFSEMDHPFGNVERVALLHDCVVALHAVEVGASVVAADLGLLGILQLQLALVCRRQQWWHMGLGPCHPFQFANLLEYSFDRLWLWSTQRPVFAACKPAKKKAPTTHKQHQHQHQQQQQQYGED